MKKVKRIISCITALALVLGMQLLPIGTVAQEISDNLPVKSASLQDSEEIPINETTFPDANFRKLVSENYDKDESGGLSESEIKSCVYIRCNEKSISDLDGIEYFTEITSLYCYRNELTSLDLSKNTKLTWLDCSDNQIKNLDVSGMPELEQLFCSRNQIQSLDVSNNTKLTWLDCGGNKLASLNVSDNTALENLYCYENQLKELDISSLTKLKNLICHINQIQNLDVSKNAELEQLSCAENQLTSLDVSNNSKLKILQCDRNTYHIGEVEDSLPIEKLPKSFDPDMVVNWYGAKYDEDTRSLTNFTSKTVKYDYECGNSHIVQFTITLDKDITETPIQGDEPGTIKYNPMNTTAVEGQNASMSVMVTGSGFSYQWQKYNNGSWVNISGAVSSTLTFNKVTSDMNGTKYRCLVNGANISKKSTEAFFRVVSSEDGILINEKNFPDPVFRYGVYTNSDGDRNGVLSEQEILETYGLDVQGDPYHVNTETGEIIDPQYSISDLTGIELFTNLTALYCDRNKISKIDVSKNTDLVLLYCSGNLLTELDLSNNTNLEVLQCESNKLTTLNISNKKGMSVLYVGGNPIKDFDPSLYPNLKGFGCGNMQLTTLDVSGMTDLETLACFNNNLKELDLSNNTKLIRLVCYLNDLTELDLSNNTELTWLNCSKNKLTDIDLNHVADNLTNLYIGGNPIKDFDPSIYPNLQYLECGDMQLTALDVSDMADLEYLNCSSNYLTNLNLKNNSKLKALFCNKNNLTSLDLKNNPELTNIYCEGNNYNIGENIKTFDLNKLLGNFDASKASNWNGADYDPSTNSISNITGKTVTYQYEVKDGYKVTFALTKGEVSDDTHTHTPVKEYTSNASGHWHNCTGCSEKVDFAAHTEDSGTITKQPTMTEEGEKTYKCKVCGYVIRTEAVSKLSDSAVAVYDGTETKTFDDLDTALKAYKTTTNALTITLNKDANVKTLALPTKAGSITFTGTGALNVSAASITIPANTTFDVEVNGKGKTLAVKVSAGKTLDINNKTSNIGAVSGTKTSTLNVSEDTEVLSIATFGTVNVEDGKRLP